MEHFRQSRRIFNLEIHSGVNCRRVPSRGLKRFFLANDERQRLLEHERAVYAALHQSAIAIQQQVHGAD
jgi:hypothetical protein